MTANSEPGAYDDSVEKGDYGHGDPTALKNHSFSSFEAYGSALVDLPRRLRYRSVAVWTIEQETGDVKARSKEELKKNLHWFDLINFGVGAMVGAGIFVTTGQLANEVAGPAIILSYVVAGISALLSAFCYTEFAIQVPVAGGAFTYLRITLGEFASFFTASNLIMEYVLSGAALARGFTSFFASIFGYTNPDQWRIYVPVFAEGYQELDPIAMGLVILLVALLCWGAKESSWFNLVTTIIHFGFLAFIIVAGFAKGNSGNITAGPGGFFPFGVHGIFDASAIAYFSYIGYDAVATLAEETVKPARDIPIGIVGSVIITTALYCLLCLSLTFLVPYDQINTQAPFFIAFSNSGWPWAVQVVGVGATLGTVTSTMMSLMGQARYMTAIGRSHLVPVWFAKVNAYTHTPVNSTIFLGCCTAILAFFTSLDILINMVSIGTLFVFYMVSQALIFRRHYKKGVNNPLPTLLYLFVFTASTVCFIVFYQLQRDKYWGLILCLVAAVLETLVFWLLCPQVHVPDTWKTPLMPWMGATSVFLNVLLLGSLDQTSYERFGIFAAAVILLYLLYSVHVSWDLEGTGLGKGEGEGEGADESQEGLVSEVVSVEGSDLKGEDEAGLVGKA